LGRIGRKGEALEDKVGKIESDMSEKRLGNVFGSYEASRENVKRFTIYEWLAEIEKVLLGVKDKQEAILHNGNDNPSPSNDGEKSKRGTSIGSVKSMRVGSIHNLFRWLRIDGVELVNDRNSTESMRLRAIFAELHRFIDEQKCCMEDPIPDILARRAEVLLEKGFETPEQNGLQDQGDPLNGVHISDDDPDDPQQSHTDDDDEYQEYVF
jgi:hypothetical protein